MSRNLALIVIIILVCGGILFFASGSVNASAVPQTIATATFLATPTFDTAHLAQLPTVFPPAQADNGAQIYWGMCMAVMAIMVRD